MDQRPGPARTNSYGLTDGQTVALIVGLVVGLSLIVAPAAFFEVVDAVNGVNPPGPGYIPLGSALEFGPATVSTCPNGDTFGPDECSVHDFVSSVPVRDSTVEAYTFAPEVVYPNGAVAQLSGAAGLALVGVNGTVLAYVPATGDAITMGAWVYSSGAGPTTVVTPGDLLVVDLGPNDPVGTDWSLVAVAVGEGYTGDTSAALLG